VKSNVASASLLSKDQGIAGNRVKFLSPFLFSESVFDSEDPGERRKKMNRRKYNLKLLMEYYVRDVEF
jgi:hypothetical protein